MTKKRRAVALFSAVVLTLSVIFALVFANLSENNPQNGLGNLHTETATIESFLAAGDKITIMDGKSETYSKIVYGTTLFAGTAGTANAISEWFYKYADLELEKASATSPTENVVTLGRVSNIPLSITLSDAVEAYPEGTYAWGIAYENGVLAIAANSKLALDAPKSVKATAHDLFDDLYAGLGKLIDNGTIVVTEGLFSIFTITAEEYQKLVADDEASARGERIENLKKLISELKNSDFDPSGDGYTSDLYSLTSTRYEAPEKYPIDSHPRVYFNSDMIDGIREAMTKSENANAVREFWEYADQYSTGELDEKKLTASTYNNYNGAKLDQIQAKALAYVLTGDEYYGYGAILMMQNFLRTLDYDARYSDQCREFGNIMYTAACVYDWCNDLLTDDDKFRIISGVEEFCLIGSVPNTAGIIASSSSAVKMEIGFPPTKQGAATGHGSENQLLRDYLSFAIAIYDDAPGWYELIAGRFYEQYVPIRNQYYSAGLVPQGTGGYNSGRYEADLFSACLMLAATGENPYNDAAMAQVAYGLVAPLTNVATKDVFSVGDFFLSERASLTVGIVPMVSSYLFDDPIMRGVAKWLNPGFSKFDSGTSGMSPAEFLIYSSRGTETEEDPFSEFPLVTYNGGWYGQIISRNTWGENAAIALMKIQEKTTANHDHAAAGTFQIYYKGILTGDMGDYVGTAYSSAHCKYFLRSTIAHNGLLIYNTSYANNMSGYYSGGQRQDLGEPSHTSWSGSQYNTGEVTGYRYAYNNDMTPAFAYIAGDITAAYDSATVDYVGRTMLTVYTDDPEAPMLMFVFDRIDADSADFKKTFLLQVPVEEAPVIDSVNKTVTITNGEGKLILKNILGGDTFTGRGGTDENGNRLNYQVNNGSENSYVQLSFYGRNYPTNDTPSDGTSWGRVEISPAKGNETDIMLNVMYVADNSAQIDTNATNLKAYQIGKDGVLLEGATAGDVTALFATSQTKLSEGFNFTANGSGMMKYYIGGLYRGTWNVYADGVKLGNVYSTNESGMVTFEAPAGVEIKLVPGDDIRPANSGVVGWNLNGGVWVSGKLPFEFYPLGETKALPDGSLVSKDGYLFQGWCDAEGNPITEIPADAGEAYTVYATWKIDPTVIDDDYSEKTETSSNLRIPTSSYNQDGGYQLWTVSTTNGPSIFLDGKYQDYGSYVFSYELELARNGNDTVIDTYLRFRHGKNNGTDIYLMYIDNAGVVKTGDKAIVITTLTEQPQKIRMTVDFENGKIIYYSNDYGAVLHERTFSPPANTGVSTTKEMLDTMTLNELFSMRGNQMGQLRIHGIRVIAENIFNKDIGNSIVYNTNGGEFTDGTETTAAYDTANGTALSTNIEREGYTFGGWYTDPNFTAASRVESVPAGTTGGYPVYALWVSHTVNYVTNEGTFAETPDTAYTPGTAKPLATNITKPGYSFDGWYTSSTFEEGTLVTEVPADAYNVYTVYAKWVKNTITYNTNGGVFTVVPSDSYTPGEDNALPTDITNGIFVFDGWYTTSDFQSGTKVTAIPKDQTGAFEVYAKWTLEGGDQIYYVTNDGIFSADPELDYKVNSVLSTNITREGYTFLGWYTDPEFKNEVSEVPENFSGVFIVYAKWFKTIIINQDMTGIVGVSANYVECAGHTDVNTDGKCDSCTVCIDIKTCHNTATNNGASEGTCAACGRVWNTDKASAAISSDSGKMDMRNYAAAKYDKININGNDALLIDVQYNKDDGIYYIGNKEVTTNLLSYLSDENGTLLVPMLEFSIDLAKLADKTTPTFSIRFFTERRSVLYVNNGKVYLGDSASESMLLADLTTELQTVKLKINTEKLSEGTIVVNAYSNVKGEYVSKTLSGTLTADGIFQWRFSGTTNSAIIVDNITVKVPAIGDTIIYPADAVLPEGAPVEYEPGITALPATAERVGYEFLGWYDNEALEGDPITKVPEDAQGRFKVYAKWGKGALVDVKNEYVNDTQVIYATAEPCYDANKDGKCDECSACMHIEATDNVCNACGLNANLCAAHTDVNTDSKCDTCGYYASQKTAHTFSKGNLNNGMSSGTGGSCYAKYEMVDNGDSDYVRVTMMKNADGGPAYSTASSNTSSLASYIADLEEKKITFSMTVGRDDTTDYIIPFQARTRNEAKNLNHNLFGLTSDGKLHAGSTAGTEIGELPAVGTMTTVSIVLDFDNGTMDYFVDGIYKTSTTFNISLATSLDGTAEKLINVRFNACNGHASLRFGNISITAGAAYTKPAAE